MLISWYNVVAIYTKAKVVNKYVMSPIIWWYL